MITTQSTPPAEPSAAGQRLRQANLTPRQMQCLAMYYYDGLSQQQIGGELAIGQRAVSQHIQYGQRKLKAAKLVIRQVSMDVSIKITHMDTDALDSLRPEITRAVW